MRLIMLALCGALAAGCNQTASPQTASAATPAAQKTKPGKTQVAQAPTTNCEQAVAKVRNQQMNSAMLGGALSMVGGLGGFAGQGGAIAAQAVSVGGSVIQAKAQNDAQDAIRQECLS